MTNTVNLTIKIDPALKEQIKQLALENQISMSQEIVQRLQGSLQTSSSQDTESDETRSDTFSADEVKQIRALLKKQAKKKK